MDISVSLCGQGVLCGPAWHSSSSSSSVLILKPESSPCQLPCLRHGVSPAEGKPRESGSQLPASSRQNCISASPGFGPSRVSTFSSPAEGRGRETRSKKGNFHFFLWLGSTWLRAATHLVGGEDYTFITEGEQQIRGSAYGFVFRKTLV